MIFHPLEKEHLIKIVDLQLVQLNQRVKEHGMELVVDDDVREWITDKGYEPAYGARPMRRVIQKYIEAPLSDEIIKGTFTTHHRVRVYMKDGEIAFKPEPALAEV